METSYRDNAVAKNKLVLKLLVCWALSSSLLALILSILCFYAFQHKETHWLPVCMGTEFSIGNSAYSPAYLKEMTVKATDLRLTYSPDTVESRYSTLLHLVPANFQESFKKQLDEEIETVKSKNISSVFYAEKVAVDVNHHQGQIEGELYRTSHGLEVKPQHKAYLLQFAFKQGVLSLKSVKEVSHEKN